MPPDVYSKPSLPPRHYDSYVQYKTSDAEVLHWVHAAILTLRHKKRSQTVRGPTQRNARIKAGQSSQGPDFNSAKVPLNMLLKFVMEIADSDIDIPDKTINLLNKSIELRKAVGSFYSGLPDPTRSNKTHQHAIEVFTEALQILREAKRRDTSTAGVFYLSLSIRVQDDDFSLARHTLELAGLLEELPPALVGAEDNEWLRDNPGINRKGK